MRLFLTHGYTQTTLNDIADTVGCGRTSIYRYWSGKPDIVWAEFDRHNASLAERLADADAAQPPLAAVRHAIVANHRHSMAQTDAWIQRFELIHFAADLRAGEAERWAVWAGHVAEFVARFTALDAPHVAPAIGAAFQASFVAVLESWREREPNDAALLPELDQTLADLERHLTPWIEAHPRH